MKDYLQRKLDRSNYFDAHVKGWKLRPCICCNGTGRYDSNGSPKCGNCEGTGKERYK